MFRLLSTVSLFVSIHMLLYTSYFVSKRHSSPIYRYALILQEDMGGAVTDVVAVSNMPHISYILCIINRLYALCMHLLLLSYV